MSVTHRRGMCSIVPLCRPSNITADDDEPRVRAPAGPHLAEEGLDITLPEGEAHHGCRRVLRRAEDAGVADDRRGPTRQVDAHLVAG